MISRGLREMLRLRKGRLIIGKCESARSASARVVKKMECYNCLFPGVEMLEGAFVKVRINIKKNSDPSYLS